MQQTAQHSYLIIIQPPSSVGCLHCARFMNHGRTRNVVKSMCVRVMNLHKMAAKCLCQLTEVEVWYHQKCIKVVMCCF